MSTLSEKSCKPCRGETDKLDDNEVRQLASQISDWRVQSNHHLYKAFKFPDFKSALEFVNEVGDIAEGENHHPNITFTWGKVELSIFTHKVDGLTEADFILAAKIDSLST